MRSQLAMITALTVGASNFVLAECNTHVLATTPAERFVIGEGTVTDTTTGLMWKRCAEGFQWNGETCDEDSATPQGYSWSEALAVPSEQTFAGFSDWRLPNKIELASIVEYQCFEPAIDEAIFPGTPVNRFWSNSPNNFNISFVWTINFARGEHTNARKDEALAIRLVRDLKQ